MRYADDRIRMFPWIFGSVFLVVGLVPLWLAMRTFAKDRAIARWPRAPGWITMCRIDSHMTGDRDEHGHHRRYLAYDPVVEFTYTVDGRQYRGNRLARVVMTTTTPPDLSRYPVGQDVQVSYDPNDAGTAYLEVRRSTGAVVLCILGGVFTTIGVLVPTLVWSLG